MRNIRTQTGFLSGSMLLLIGVLLLGLALRLALWDNLPRNGLISDEGEYLAAATWLAEGRNLSWYQGYLWTRAPLYPLFVATHFRLFDSDLTPVFVSQTALSMLNVILVFLLAHAMLDSTLARDSKLRIADSRLKIEDFQPDAVFRSLAKQQKQSEATDQQREATNNLQSSIFNLQSRTALIAAGMMALYLPFAIYGQVLLSETLFVTLLLAAILCLTIWHKAQRGAWFWLIAGGVLLGLCVLTRGLALGFVPIAALWAGHMRRRPLYVGLSATALLATCALGVVLPWTFYNSTRLYNGLVIVDTTGAFNLLLGAQTAFDGQRTDAATRDKVLALLADIPPEQRIARLVQARACIVQPRASGVWPALLDKPVLTQADRQELMLAEALCLVRERPLAFIQKSLGELIDLFQINYGGDERFSDGFAGGRLPAWYALALFLLDDTLYVLTLPLAVIGWALSRELPGRGLIGLWWGYNLAVAPLLFAINRFRLPLMPFVFLFAALALVALVNYLTTPRDPLRATKRFDTSTLSPALVLAALLFLLAAMPYAYFEPRAAGADSRWASYLGPYPSSFESTRLALRERDSFLRGEALRAALRANDQSRAQELLAQGGLPLRLERAAQVVLLGLERRPQDALAVLPAAEVISATRDVQASVLRGDVLRHLGQERAAKDAFTPAFVDSANPVQWTWEWLHPTATLRIDFGGNLDLGYITGCYLGEGDPSGGGTFRWCGDGAQLRFVGAGSGKPQTLTLRTDGRGWPNTMRSVPAAQVFVGDILLGSFPPNEAVVGEVTLELPATPPGSDILVTLRTPTFIPDAADYLAQQGAQAGQLRRLGLRLDWAELRNNQ